MRGKIILHVLFIAILCGSAYGQSHPVKLKVKHDGKEVSGRLRIILYLDGATLEPSVTDGTFYLPDLKGHEKVDVRLIAGNDDLLFKGIYTSKFDNFEGELVFGVKSKRFKPEDIPSWQKPTDELVAIHYLEFQPKDADGTCVTLYLYKDTFIESH